MRKEDKAIIIEQLGARLKEYPHLYLVDVTGLNAEATSNLRRKCFATDVKMIVAKNSLLEKAFDQAEMDYSPLKPCLKGTTALFLSNVANAPAKLIKEFGKDGVPALKGAYAEEGFYVGAENLAALCAIKSKNEVIGDIIGLLQSPLRNILSGLEARFDKEEGAAE